MQPNESFRFLFIRDLNRLRSEIESYSNEDQMWSIQNEIKNSAGNLCLHIIGNLNHFIGHIIGNSGYTRDRSFEFEGKHVSKASLLQDIDALKQSLTVIFADLSADDLEANYPIQLWDYEMSVHHFLIHLSGHMMYHIGQINYHRRLLDK